MNNFENEIFQRIKIITEESKDCINLIYASPCVYSRNILFYQLLLKINEIDFLSGMLCNKNTSINGDTQGVYNQQSQKNQRDLTLQELAKFNGKDGNPAYVAVNGTVYDVTNNAAWAAASHFGLSAGKDLTGEFSSCHASQPILSKLKVVGKLI